MKNWLLAAFVFVSVFCLFFAIQSMGTFEYSYKRSTHFTHDDKALPVQSIVYSPPFGERIESDGKDISFLTPGGPYLDLSEKMPYFKQAILNKKYLPLSVAIPFSLLFYFIMNSKQRNSG